MTRSSCPLCNSEIFFEYLDFGYAAVMKCKYCALMFSKDVGSAEEVINGYRTGFHSERHKKGQSINALISYKLLSQLPPQYGLSSTDRLLEVGSGYGYFLSEVERLSDSRVGIEPSNVERTFSQNLNYQVEHYSALDEVAGATFDFVFSSEVIEHVVEPRLFLEQLKSCVRPGGRVVLVTDNFESHIASAMKKHFPKWIPHSHVCHFSKSTLHRLTVECGLEVLCEFDFTPFDALILYWRWRLGLSPNTANTQEYRDTEFARGFKFYSIRKFLNALVFSIFGLGEKGRGSLIGIVALRR